jgi:hypothetical protein
MKWWERLAQNAGDDIAWWVLFIAVSGVGASLMGLSVLLRSGMKLTARAVAGALLHSLLWGIVIFLVSYGSMKNELPMLLGLSILSGLGTASVADLLLMVVKHRLGISVTINPPKKD